MYESVESDETDAPLLAVLMAATTILTVFTILATIALFYWSRESISEAYANEDVPKSQVEKEAQETLLGESRWIDKEAGKLSVPLQTAKELLLKEGLQPK